MSLRKRLASLFMLLLALTLLIVSELSDHLLLSHYDQQDRLRLQIDVDNVRDLIIGDIHRNTDLLHSYARWDGVCQVLQDIDCNDFLRQKISRTKLADVGFDFIVLVDAAGTVLAEQWDTSGLLEVFFPINHDRPDRISTLRHDILQRSQDLKLLRHDGDLHLQSGQLILVQGVPLLLAASPVEDSQGNSTVMGVLLGGTFLEGKKLHDLREQLDGDLRLLPVNGLGQTWHPLDKVELHTQISARYVVNDQLQRVDLLLNNNAGEPELRLQLTQERLSFRKGRETIQIFLGISLLVGLAAALLVYVGLEFWVLRRLARLNSEIGNVGGQAVLPRIGDLGRDELGQIGCSLNQMFERLEQSEARDRAILDSIQDGYFEVDAEGRIQHINRALISLLGFSSEELIGQNFINMLDSDEAARARQILSQAKDSNQSCFSTALKRGDGSIGYFEARFAPILAIDGSFSGYHGILRDISDQVAHQRYLHDLAHHDPLTGLGNRKAFNDQMQQCISRALAVQRPLALLFIDLDHFKQANDRYGHDVGDALLSAIAARLQRGVREFDKLYRLGGDEFTLLLPDTTAEEAIFLGKRLLESLVAPFDIFGVHIDFVTPSIGISLCPEHAENATGLVKAADNAMYQAKHERNRVCLYQRR